MSRIPDLVIAHGTVVNSFGRRNAHVVVRDGRIEQLIDAAEPVPAAGRTIDATGLLVVPGGVDGHCHVAQVTGRFRTLDDYAPPPPQRCGAAPPPSSTSAFPATPRKPRWRPSCTRRNWHGRPAATSPCTARW